MTGRGIDQILSHPCAPLLHENYVKSARDYIRLAEQVNGRGPRAVKFSYIWGAGCRPRLVNLNKLDSTLAKFFEGHIPIHTMGA
jgi:hypothetical protein